MRAAEQARWAGADAQARMGSPRWRRPARYASLSSPLPHVALIASTCDTGVPTVRALVGKGMQLLRENMRSSPADVLLYFRQSEKKFVCRERYTQLREGGRPEPLLHCRFFLGIAPPADAPTPAHYHNLKYGIAVMCDWWGSRDYDSDHTLTLRNP